MTILTLLGSGEFTSNTSEIDRFLLDMSEKKLKSKKVSIFPTAAGKETDYDKWIQEGIRHFKKLGAEPIGIPAIKKEDFERNDFIQMLSGSGIIYFSGGHPGHLLNSLKDTSLWKKILELYKNGVILAGSSAGAMVLGNYVLSNAQEVFMGDDYPIWEEALGLIDYPIIPHYDFIENEGNKFDGVLEKTPNKIKKKLLGIDENTGLVVYDGKKGEVWGKGKLHIIEDNKEKVYKKDSKVII